MTDLLKMLSSILLGLLLATGSPALSSVVTESKQETLSECVMTFAYWKRDFLQQSRLLNAQMGDCVNVEAQLLGNDLLSVRGISVPTYRYRLTGKDLSIDLWYSHEHQSLALESMTDGGRRLRYEHE